MNYFIEFLESLRWYTLGATIICFVVAFLIIFLNRRNIRKGHVVWAIIFSIVAVLSLVALFLPVLLR